MTVTVVLGVTVVRGRDDDDHGRVLALLALGTFEISSASTRSLNRGDQTYQVGPVVLEVHAHHQSRWFR